jgi:hypothetical protein
MSATKNMYHEQICQGIQQRTRQRVNELIYEEKMRLSVDVFLKDGSTVKSFIKLTPDTAIAEVKDHPEKCIYFHEGQQLIIDKPYEQIKTMINEC